MGARRIFSRGGQWGGLTDASPQQGQGAAARWGSGGEAPEADDIFSKWCISTSSADVSDNICSKKTLFNISGEGGKFSPCPCLRSPMPNTSFDSCSQVGHSTVYVKPIGPYVCLLESVIAFWFHFLLFLCSNNSPYHSRFRTTPIPISMKFPLRKYETGIPITNLDPCYVSYTTTISSGVITEIC